MEISRNYKIFMCLMAVLIVTNIIDIVATKFLLESGLFYEVDPIKEQLFDRFGVVKTLLLMKCPAIIMLVIGGVITKNPSKLLMSLMWTVTAVYTALAFWHFFLTTTLFL